jgi:hypothetical protein
VLPDGGDVGQGPVGVEPSSSAESRHSTSATIACGIGDASASACPHRASRTGSSERNSCHNAFHPARAAVAEVVVEQVRPRQSRVSPDERLGSLVAALQELVAVGGVVEDVDVGVDDGTQIE